MNRGERSSGRSVNICSTRALPDPKQKSGPLLFPNTTISTMEMNTWTDRCSYADVQDFVVSCTNKLDPSRTVSEEVRAQTSSQHFFSPCSSRSETSGFIGPDFSRLTVQRCGAQVTNSLSWRKGQSDVFHMLTSLTGSFRRCDVKYGARTTCERRKRK